MVWFYVDDGLAFHTKVIEAGNSAMGLWVRAGAWSTGNLTDGFIPIRIARKLGTKRDADRLKSVGLWYEKPSENCQKPGGYQFHDWDHRQLTKTEVEQKRKADRARKAEQRKARNVPLGHPPDVQTESEQNPDGVTTGFREDSSRALPRACAPHPTPPFNGQFEGESHGELDPDEPPPEFCSKHPTGTDAACRGCQAAREQHETWESEQAANVVKLRAAFWAEVRACPDCDDHGYTEPEAGRLRRCPNHDWTALTDV